MILFWKSNVKDISPNNNILVENHVHFFNIEEMFFLDIYYVWYGKNYMIFKVISIIKHCCFDHMGIFFGNSCTSITVWMTNLVGDVDVLP